MNTYLAWLYNVKGAQLREVPVSERPDLGIFECIIIIMYQIQGWVQVQLYFLCVFIVLVLVPK